ncbi:CRISPR-associated protein, Cse1 family [hydrothermal vent metagenome]|uniref:CRISPR-associated protein, Cse1 family n=1 Tax=hydrothermal vent metagenome TaxID=652676 RepID=A0A3B0UVQ7_9ZZZZ
MTQQFSFNLVDEAWLPCVDENGRFVELNLRQLFAQAHQLRALEGESPPVTAALHRFLLAILHRVFGPADYDEWYDLWQAQQWEMAEIDAYLDEWRHRFDLFDAKRPFYQAPDSRVKAKSTINLSHDRASGNNPTLFDHHTEETGETLTPAQAARALIVAQSNGLAGLSGIRGQNFTDGTCSGGIIFIVEGDTLKETLLLNAIQYPPDNDHFSLHQSNDKPAWEMDDPFTPDRKYPFGYLDYLTWQNRRVLLMPEQSGTEIVVRQMTMGPALRFESSLLDPMKHYRPHKKIGHVALSFSEDRVLWQDSAALFQFHADIEGKSRQPATFRWLRELSSDEYEYLDKLKLYRCQALGMSKKQAKVFFFRAERIPMPLAYLTDEKLVAQLEDALQKTSTLAFSLLQVARRVGIYLQLPNPESQKWGQVNRNAKSAINDWVAYTGIERHYWASLDVPFQDLIINLPHNTAAAKAEWQTQLRQSAQNAFDQALKYTGSGPRSFKAVVRGESYLKYQLRELFVEELA